MHSPTTSTQKREHSESKTQSNLWLKEIYSPQEVGSIIDAMAQRYADSWGITINAVRTGMRTSEYYDKILSWTIRELADFLETFYTKKACGFFHERVIRIHGELLTQGNCAYKHSYAGCGHPELNGILIALAMAEDILGVTIQVTPTKQPAYVTLRRLDAIANTQFYQAEQSEQSLDDIVTIKESLKIKQDIFWLQVQELCQELARRLKSI